MKKKATSKIEFYQFTSIKENGRITNGKRAPFLCCKQDETQIYQLFLDKIIALTACAGVVFLNDFKFATFRKAVKIIHWSNEIGIIHIKLI